MRYNPLILESNIGLLLNCELSDLLGCKTLIFLAKLTQNNTKMGILFNQTKEKL